MIAVAGANHTAQAATLADPTVLTRSHQSRLDVTEAVYRPRAREYALVVAADTPRGDQTYELWRVGRGGRALATGRDVTPPIPDGQVLMTFSMEYDTSRDRFLQVYSFATDDEHLRYGRAAFGQLLDGDGARIGRPFRITPGAPAGGEPRGARATYVPATRGFLLTWTTERGPRDHFAWAQALGGNGRAARAPLRPIPGTVDGGYRVEYNPRGSSLLATWQNKTGVSQYARRLTARGAPAGPAQRLWSTEAGGRIIGLEFVPSRNLFVGTRGAGFTIHSERLRGTGAVRGRPARVIETMSVSSHLFGGWVHYAGRSDQLLLAWADHVVDRLHGSRTYPFVRRFNGSGRKAVGPKLALEQPESAGLPYALDEPTAAYSRRWNQFLLAWTVHEPAPEGFGPVPWERGIAVNTLRMPRKRAR